MKIGFAGFTYRVNKSQTKNNSEPKQLQTLNQDTVSFTSTTTILRKSDPLRKLIKYTQMALNESNPNSYFLKASAKLGVYKGSEDTAIRILEKKMKKVSDPEKIASLEETIKTLKNKDYIDIANVFNQVRDQIIN